MIGSDVRCPLCSALLGRVRAGDGAVVVTRSGRVVAVVRDGELACSACRCEGREVVVLVGERLRLDVPGGGVHRV
jgi:hypothetical protein